MGGIVIHAFATYAPDTFLSCGELAKTLHICPRTLRRMVLRYELPQGIRQGKQKLWSVRALLEWFRRREDENLQSAERGRAGIRKYGEGQ